MQAPFHAFEKAKVLESICVLPAVYASSNIEVYHYQIAADQFALRSPMGRFHAAWLNTMYPRLRLAANLLRDDGVIFISINDYAVATPSGKKVFMQKQDITLDFFSGSATTAHAVMQLNAEDGGNRRFICVQHCLEREITAEFVEAMAELASAKIILAGIGFADDTALANTHYIFRDRGIEIKLV